MNPTFSDQVHNPMTGPEEDAHLHGTYMDRVYRSPSSFRAGPWDAGVDRWHPWQRRDVKKFLSNIGAGKSWPMPEILEEDAATKLFETWRREVNRSYEQVHGLVGRYIDSLVPQIMRMSDKELTVLVKEAWASVAAKQPFAPVFGQTSLPLDPGGDWRFYFEEQIGLREQSCGEKSDRRAWTLPTWKFANWSSSKKGASRNFTQFNDYVAKNRLSIHIPCLNTFQLVERRLLVYLLETRARMPPTEHVRADYQACHIGRATQLLTAPYRDAWFMAFPAPDEIVDSINWKVYNRAHWDLDGISTVNWAFVETCYCYLIKNPTVEKANSLFIRELREEGRIFGFDEGLLVLQSQAAILQFCNEAGEALLRLAGGKRRRVMPPFPPRHKLASREELSLTVWGPGAAKMDLMADHQRRMELIGEVANSAGVNMQIEDYQFYGTNTFARKSLRNWLISQGNFLKSHIAEIGTDPEDFRTFFSHTMDFHYGWVPESGDVVKKRAEDARKEEAKKDAKKAKKAALKASKKKEKGVTTDPASVPEAAPETTRPTSSPAGSSGPSGPSGSGQAAAPGTSHAEESTASGQEADPESIAEMAGRTLPHFSSGDIEAKKKLVDDLLRRGLRLIFFSMEMCFHLADLLIEVDEAFKAAGLPNDCDAWCGWGLHNSNRAMEAWRQLNLHLRWYTELQLKMLIDHGMFHASPYYRLTCQRATTNQELMDRAREEQKDGGSWVLPKGFARFEKLKWVSDGGTEAAPDSKHEFLDRLFARTAFALVQRGLQLTPELLSTRILVRELEVCLANMDAEGSLDPGGWIALVADQLSAMSEMTWRMENLRPMGKDLKFFHDPAEGDAWKKNSQTGRFLLHYDDFSFEQALEADEHRNIQLLMGVRYANDLDPEHKTIGVDKARAWTKVFIHKLGRWLRGENNHGAAGYLGRYNWQKVAGLGDLTRADLAEIEEEDEKIENSQNVEAGTTEIVEAENAEEIGNEAGEPSTEPNEQDQTIELTQICGEITTIDPTIPELPPASPPPSSPTTSQPSASAPASASPSATRGQKRKAPLVPPDMQRLVLERATYTRPTPRLGHEVLSENPNRREATTGKQKREAEGEKHTKLSSRIWHTIENTFGKTGEQKSTIQWTDWVKMAVALGYSVEPRGGSAFAFTHTANSLLPKGKKSSTILHYQHAPNSSGEVRPHKIRGWCKSFRDLLGIDEATVKKYYGEKDDDEPMVNAQLAVLLEHDDDSDQLDRFLDGHDMANNNLLNGDEDEDGKEIKKLSNGQHDQEEVQQNGVNTNIDRKRSVSVEEDEVQEERENFFVSMEAARYKKRARFA